jgi:DNA replication and repair protein RecF
MQLTRLSLTNFRNFARLDVHIPTGTTLILGNNAQGKTSILEAVYFLAAMTSFHASSDRELVNFDEGRKELAVGRIVAEYQRAGREHKLEVRVIKERNRLNVERMRKEVLLDGSKKKLTEVVGHFNAVLFLPQMLTIVEGSPSERRRYIDLALAQVDPLYAGALGDYNKVLSNRNALLKQLYEEKGDPGQLEFWDERLAKRGAYLIHARIHALQELEASAARIHHELTHGKEVLRLAYDPSYDPIPAPANQMQLIDAPADRSGESQEKIEKGFRESLLALRREEISRGVTTIGPHRDEIRFLSNGIDLRTYGSRGQIRTTMLTLKMAEVDWIKSRTGHLPVLLLDEVLAELDEERRTDLLQRVQNWDQVLMTTTDAGMFSEDFIARSRLWQIQAGQLIESAAWPTAPDL